MKRGRSAALALLFLATPGGNATAADKPKHAEVPAAFAKLEACRAQADDAARLRCYDREVGAMRAAIDGREVAIVDKQEIRRTRRTLFGVPLPRIALLDDHDDEPEIKQVTATIRGVGRTAEGGLQFTLEDGAVWAQTDSWPVWSAVKPGQKVTLKRGALGSYFADLEKAVSIRVKRLR